MLLDHLVAGVAGCRIDAERLDVEMPTDEVEVAVVDVRVPGSDLTEDVHVGQADGAVRRAARIAHGADTAMLVPCSERAPIRAPRLATS